MKTMLFLHSIGFLINFLLANYICIKDPKSFLNKSCAALLFCFSLWNLGEIFYRNSALSKEIAVLFYNFSSFGWIGGSSFFLLFILKFTGKNNLVKNKLLYPLLFIPPLFLIYNQWIGNMILQLVKHPLYGWVNVWKHSIYTYLFLVYISVFIGTALCLTLVFSIKTKNPIKKKQAKVLFITALTTIILSSTSNIILPYLKVYSIPSMGDLCLIIWSAGLVYTMVKHRFLEITPSAAADNIIATMPDSLILLNKEGNIAAVNKRTQDLLGYEEKELIDQPVSIIFTDEKSIEDLLDRPDKSESYKKEDYFFKAKDGKDIPMSISRSALLDETDEIAGIVCVATDMTEYKKVEMGLRDSRQYYRALVETSPDIIFNISLDGDITALNPAFEKITGWSVDEWIGKPFQDIIHPDDHALVLEKTEKTIAGRTTHPYEMRIISKSGESLYEELISIPDIKEGKISGIFGFAHDITRRKKFEEQLRHLAYHDVLTGLPNRKSFYEHLKNHLNQTARTGNMGAVLFIDLDNFKTMNDSYGHDAGDLLLQEIAKRLTNGIRISDKAYRLGGDEFIVHLGSITYDIHAGIVAQKIHQIISEPYNINGDSFYVTPSIGISVYPKDSTDTETLLKYADDAMYRAKELGKSNYQFYSKEMNSRSKEKVKLRNNLIDAVDQRQFFLHYQPILQGNKILGVEALLRWHHPDEGMILPMEFIPLAEDVGLIQKIGEWVLMAACQKNKEWQDKGHEDLYVSVNISAKQFLQEDLLETIDRVLEETQLAPEFLYLEITESCVMENPEVSLTKMNALRTQGIRISLDDFGTGFSSLSNIKNFPVNALKIDKSFISNIVYDSRDQAIVTATIDMAREMNLDVIAEGVETEEQFEFLNSIGCTIFQGYFFWKPQSCDKLEEALLKPKFEARNPKSETISNDQNSNS